MRIMYYSVYTCISTIDNIRTYVYSIIYMKALYNMENPILLHTTTTVWLMLDQHYTVSIYSAYRLCYITETTRIVLDQASIIDEAKQ